MFMMYFSLVLAAAPMVGGILAGVAALGYGGYRLYKHFRK